MAFTQGARRLALESKRVLVHAALAASVLGTATTVDAQTTLYWDGPNNTPGNVANGRGGAGRWDPDCSGNTNWTNAAGSTNRCWASAGIAVFGGAAGGAVSFGSGGKQHSGITFNTSGYVVSGAKLNGNASNNVITTASGVSASVGSPLGTVSAGSTYEKAGAGTLTLSGAGDYTGATTISAGTLVAANATALGTTGAITVASNASLGLSGDIAIGAKALTLNGSGASGSDGALYNVSGTNTYGGAITLANAASIGSTAGTLTLGGTVATGGFGLVFAGAGNLTANGVISAGGSPTPRS